VLTACFLLWCAGQQPAPAERVTFTNDFRHSERSERIIGYERNFVVFGAVEQTTAEDAVFVGALPLNIHFGNRFRGSRSRGGLAVRAIRGSESATALR
jgi:hypothetical protein